MESRFAVVITKKRVPNAVDRNSLKRLILRIVKKYNENLLKQVDVVFILQSVLPKNEDVDREILTFFREKGILKK